MSVAFNFHTLLWVLIIILATCWFIGLVQRASKLIHFLLILALVLFLFNVFSEFFF